MATIGFSCRQGSKSMSDTTPRCVSSRTETFEDYVYRFVETRTKANISAIKHTIYDLFTMVTFLFTNQISQSEKYQSRFAASILTGYHDFAETRRVNHDRIITIKKQKINK